MTIPRLVLGFVFAASLGAAPDWMTIGGQFTGKIAVVDTLYLQVFVRGSDNALWTNHQGFNGEWTGWSSLGGSFVGDPVVGVNRAMGLQVFVRADDGSVWTIAQSGLGGPFGAWQNLGGYVTSDPAVAGGYSGLEVFGVGGDTSLWTTYQVPGGGWSPWSSLGGSFINNPGAVDDAQGNLRVFALGTDNALWSRSTATTLVAGNWSGWTSLGGSSTGDPAIVIPGNESLEIFIRALDNPSVINYTFLSNGAWAPMQQLDVSNSGITSNPSAVRDAVNEVNLTWRGSDNTLWTIVQQGADPASATWIRDESVGALLAAGPTTIMNVISGNIEAFIQCVDNTLWFVQQTSPGYWNGTQAGSGLLHRKIDAIDRP